VYFVVDSVMDDSSTTLPSNELLKMYCCVFIMNLIGVLWGVMKKFKESKY
jgi:hypothetical protein